MWKVAEVTIFIILNCTKKSPELFHAIFLSSPKAEARTTACLSCQFLKVLSLTSLPPISVSVVAQNLVCVSPHCVPEFQVCILRLRIWGLRLFPSTFQIKSWQQTNVSARDKLHSFLKIILGIQTNNSVYYKDTRFHLSGGNTNQTQVKHML